MIEMLGVLAIIAVLSIGGLLGYRRAVNNHHANVILDDASRLAFVMIESNQAFGNNEYITNSLEFTQNSIYNTEAFLGASAGQFGIIVESVPRGVCESLVPKAAVEYKVRVLPSLPDEEVYQVLQMSDIGTVYDSFHKDICGDENDVVLYFNDTSAQCNKPDEGETYTKCLSNADCCGGYFCNFPRNDDDGATPSEPGTCRLVENAITARMLDGSTWVRSKYGMTWWSAQNWCEAQGLQPATRANIGCDDIQKGSVCASAPIDANVLTNASAWNGAGCWLDSVSDAASYQINFVTGVIGSNFKHGWNFTDALCRVK